MQVSVFVGVSLDGYLARLDGRFDFLTISGAEHDNGYEAFIATVDCLIIGRATYEVVSAFDSWPYGSKTVFVLSSRPLPPTPYESKVEHIAGTPADIHSQVAARGHQHAYIDGGSTIQSFLRAGLVDRMVITRVPVLIGTGVPLFGTVNQDTWLRHRHTRILRSGAVQSEYAGPPASSPQSP